MMNSDQIPLLKDVNLAGKRDNLKGWDPGINSSKSKK